MNENCESFDRRADSICRNAAKKTNNLTDALQACEGLFPTLAVPQFAKIDRERTEHWLREAAEKLKISQFVNEHSASYVLSTWDFCSEQIEAMGSVAWHSKSRICLLGTPSLVQYLPDATAIPPHVLIDLRAPSTEMSRNIIRLPYDINSLDGSEFAGAFDVCFLDPPWYVENYLKWIDIAASYCRAGGVVAFALLGGLTRPSAEDDRDRILQYCCARGLTVELHDKYVLYETPSFERHTLQRAGIPPVRWKRADLVVATYDRQIMVQSRAEPPPRLLPFQQASLGELTIDIVFDRYENSARKNVAIPLNGYWMKTPSRREPGQKDCNVFTSNGARFVSPKPVDLYAELLSMQGADFKSCRGEIQRLGFPLDIFEAGQDNHPYSISIVDDKSRAIGRQVSGRLPKSAEIPRLGINRPGNRRLVPAVVAILALDHAQCQHFLSNRMRWPTQKKRLDT